MGVDICVCCPLGKVADIFGFFFVVKEVREGGGVGRGRRKQD